MLQQSEGRGTAGGTGTTRVRTVPVPQVCGSPHTADVVGDHVAALVAAECFGKFWEILKGAQYPVSHREVEVKVIVLEGYFKLKFTRHVFSLRL